MNIPQEVQVLYRGDSSPSLVQFCDNLRPYSRPGYLTTKEATMIGLLLIEQLAEGKCDPDMLKFGSRFLIPTEYDELTVERNIVHLCGYPLCDADPKGIRNKHQINYQRPNPDRMILPNNYLHNYCSREHYQASAFYRKQLSELSVFARKDITFLPYGQMEYELQTALLEEVIYRSSHEVKSMEDVITEFKTLSMDQQQQQQPTEPKPPADPFLVDLANQMKEFHLVERTPSSQAQPPVTGDTHDVEGYSSSFNQFKG